MFRQLFSHRNRLKETNLEAAVIFCDFVCEVDLLSLAQELSQLGPVIHAQVVTYKVPVEAVSPPLLPVQQQVRRWINPERERVRGGNRSGRTDTWSRKMLSSLTLFPHLDILLAGHVLPPGFLDGPGVAVKLALPRLFQQKELWKQTKRSSAT